MAKVTGRPVTVTVDDVLGTPTDITNDVTSVTFATPQGTQDVTGLDKTAIERMLLLADCTVTLGGVFNSALSHAVLATTCVSSVARTTAIALAGPVTLTAELIFADYTVSRPGDGSLSWSATGSLSSGTAAAWT